MIQAARTLGHAEKVEGGQPRRHSQGQAGLQVHRDTAQDYKEVCSCPRLLVSREWD